MLPGPTPAASPVPLLPSSLHSQPPTLHLLAIHSLNSHISVVVILELNEGVEPFVLDLNDLAELLEPTSEVVLVGVGAVALDINLRVAVSARHE